MNITWSAAATGPCIIIRRFKEPSEELNGKDRIEVETCFLRQIMPQDVFSEHGTLCNWFRTYQFTFYLILTEKTPNKRNKNVLTTCTKLAPLDGMNISAYFGAIPDGHKL